MKLSMTACSEELHNLASLCQPIISLTQQQETW